LSRAGGKGINVARVTHQLGLPRPGHRALPAAPQGRPSQRSLWTSGVPHTLVGVAAETRRSIALVDTVAGETSIFNEEGQALLPDDWRSLRTAVVEAVSGNPNLPASVLVGSGSLPPGRTAETSTRHWCGWPTDAGIPAIIDTSGPGIIARSQSRVPTSSSRTTTSSLRPRASPASKPPPSPLIAMGARTVLVSAGADGMLAFDHAAPGRLLECAPASKR
jgi:fructose-1-phosphate kinase PfkB-like protein